MIIQNTAQGPRLRPQLQHRQCYEADSGAQSRGQGAESGDFTWVIRVIEFPACYIDGMLEARIFKKR